MQTAEPEYCDYLAACTVLRHPASGRLLRRSQMRSVIAVIADVFDYETLQMPLVENDDMIKQVSSAAADESLRNAVPPRAAEAGSLRPDAKSRRRCFTRFLKTPYLLARRL